VSDTAAAAAAAAAAAKAEAEAEAAADPITVSGLMDVLKQEYMAATASNYINIIKGLAAAAGFSQASSSQVLVSELLQQQHVQRYVQHMHKHYAATTMQLYVGRLRKMLSIKQVQAQLAQGMVQQLASLLSGKQPAAEAGAPEEPAEVAEPALAKPAVGKGRRKRRSADTVMEDPPGIKEVAAEVSHPVRMPADDAADSDDGDAAAAAATDAPVGRRQPRRLQPQLQIMQPEVAPKGAPLPLPPPPPSPAEGAVRAEAEAAAAAAARADSATAVMMAEDSLPDLFAPLQPSRDQKRRFYSLMHLLAELRPGDIRLDKFWCDEDVSVTPVYVHLSTQSTCNSMRGVPEWFTWFSLSDSQRQSVHVACMQRSFSCMLPLPCMMCMCETWSCDEQS
jgi:hypothetical protein